MPSPDALLGTLHRHQSFPSRFIDPRQVDVWLPPASLVKSTRLPVLYMHDGQNLFDPSLSYSGVDWGMDEAVVSLAGSGQISPLIIVGIWNSPKRVSEYMPQRPCENSAKVRASVKRITPIPPFSDDYLRFIVEELKPFVDSSYPTLPDQPHTFIMGSSMGGLISLYALESYPQVFGGAGCISTHWLIGRNDLVDALASALPAPGRHRLYFDYGTKKLDGRYERFQQRMDAALAQAGYMEGKDWLTRRFDGDEHNEICWRRRVHIPLEFLLGNPSLVINR